MSSMLDLLASVAKEAKIKRDLQEAKKKRLGHHQQHHGEENTAIVPIHNAMEDYPDFFPRECRRRRSPRKVLGKITVTEDGPSYDMINDDDKSDHHGTTPGNGNPLSREEVLRMERLLKRPIESSDDEKRVKNVELVDFFNDCVRGKGHNGIVIREGVQKSEREKHDKYLMKRPLEDNSGNDPEVETIKVRKISHDDDHRMPRYRIFRSGQLQDSNQPWEETRGKEKKKLNLKKKGDGDNHGVIKKNKGFRKIVDEGPNPPPGLPEEVMDKIRQKAQAAGQVIGDDFEVILVIQKALKLSDIIRQQNRFTIPSKQLRNRFLNEEEENYILGKTDGRCNYHTVPVIEPKGKVRNVNLGRWNVGKSSISYIVNGDWKEIVPKNKLRVGQFMQLWAFRINGNLNLAFVKLPGGTTENTSAATSSGRDADEAYTSQAATQISPGRSDNGSDYGDEYMASTSHATALVSPNCENMDTRVELEHVVAHSSDENKASKSGVAAATDPEDDE